MQPTMDASACIHQAQDRSWRQYVVRTPDGAMRTSPQHVYYPWQVFQRWRLQLPEGPLHQGSATQDARRIRIFQDRPLPRPKHVGATATIFVAAQSNRTSPERIMDGCCHYHFKTSFKPGRKCRRRRGLGRSSKDLNRRSFPDYPARRPGGDWPYVTREHSRVSRAAPRAGPATVARNCGPAGPPRGRGSAWADNESSWAAPPEDVPESRGPCRRTRCALLPRYAFGDDTIGSRGFIAAVTRTAGPRPFAGADLLVNQWPVSEPPTKPF
jgi:hypothetical protein